MPRAIPCRDASTTKSRERLILPSALEFEARLDDLVDELRISDADAGRLRRENRSRSHAGERVRLERPQLAILVNADIRAAVTRAADRKMRGLRNRPNATGELLRKFRRGHFAAFAVVLRFVIKIFTRRHAHFRRRKRRNAVHIAAARFAAGDELFAQQAVAVLEKFNDEF